MLKHLIHWKQYLPFALIATLAYIIPAIFFIRDANYTQSWLLFLGNMLFLFAVMGFLFLFNSRRDQNAGSTTMMTAGHILTVMGIIFSFILCLILLIVMVPGLFQPGLADKVLEDAPANTEGGKTHGLVFKVLISSIVGNAAGGLFASTILPFTLKGDQTKDSIPVKQREL